MSRTTRPDGPLDLLLQRLRVHHLAYRWDERDLKIWQSCCPICRSGGWDLRIRESRRGGPITLICGNGHTDAEIRVHLERDPPEPVIHRLEVDLAYALDVAEESRKIAEAALTHAKVDRHHGDDLVRRNEQDPRVAA
jgi:hypothetical protein